MGAGCPVNPRVLFLDCETSPNLVWTFGLKNAFISPNQIVEPTRILCFAACWLDSPDQMMFYSEWQHGRNGMLSAAYGLLQQADIIVHYNGEKFDEKRFNQEFAQLGWGPPAPFQRIDLWRTINKRFDLPSQKLEYALQHFGLSEKQSTGGIRLWIGVLAGDEKDRRKMEEYNRNDVAIMVPLYARLRPWITGHPNMNLYEIGTDNQHAGWVCPVCSSPDVQKRGFQRTDVSLFQRYRCNACGTWSREARRLGGSDLRGVAA
jgi:RNase_H superfamily